MPEPIFEILFRSRMVHVFPPALKHEDSQRSRKPHLMLASKINGSKRSLKKNRQCYQCMSVINTLLCKPMVSSTWLIALIASSRSRKRACQAINAQWPKCKLYRSKGWGSAGSKNIIFMSNHHSKLQVVDIFKPPPSSCWQRKNAASTPSIPQHKPNNHSVWLTTLLVFGGLQTMHSPVAPLTSSFVPFGNSSVKVWRVRPVPHDSQAPSPFRLGYCAALATQCSFIFDNTNRYQQYQIHLLRIVFVNYIITCVSFRKHFV